MVDILSCVLSGANWGPFTPPFAIYQTSPERNVGKEIGRLSAKDLNVPENAIRRLLEEAS